MSDKYITKDDVIKYGALFYLYKKLQPTKKQLIAYTTVYVLVKIRKPIKATFNYTKDSVKTYKKSGSNGLSDKFVKDLTVILDESDEEHARGVQRRQARRERERAAKSTVTKLTFGDGQGRVDTVTDAVDTVTEGLPPKKVATPNKPKPRAKAKAKPKTSTTS